jgi:mRNA-degrading endonuclease YafQ of YafQ-DinJ toxin-antitoxin module
VDASDHAVLHIFFLAGVGNVRGRSVLFVILVISLVISKERFGDKRRGDRVTPVQTELVNQKLPKLPLDHPCVGRLEDCHSRHISRTVEAILNVFDSPNNHKHTHFIKSSGIGFGLL